MANNKTTRSTPADRYLAGRRRFLACAATLAAGAVAGPAFGAAPASEFPSLQLTVEREGGAVVVRASTDVSASTEQTFATLADYDHLADFIPDMASSRTVSREGTSAVVEQRGRASFGPFEQRFTVLLAIEEEPGATIRARVAGGDFKRFDAEYTLTAIETNTTRIAYRAALEPAAGVPPLVGVPIMRGAIRRQFTALVNEIGRRARA